MKCPYCGYNNLEGNDECESCHEDLTAISGLIPKTKFEKVLMSDPVAKLIPRAPLLIPKETNLLEAIQKMNQAKVGYVLIMNGEKLEGILTERDIVFKVVGANKNLSKTSVTSVMTANPETLTSDASLAYALNRMSIGGYRHLPILKGGVPVGIISIRDVLKYLAKLFP